MRAILILLVLQAVSCKATHQPPVNEQPKYGMHGYATIWEATKADERARLIEDSQHAATRGWQFLRSNDPSTAMRRFNQAWTLHPQNADALWGMAIVMLTRAEQTNNNGAASDALKMMNPATDLVEEALLHKPDEPPLKTDAALIHATRGGLLQHLGQPQAETDFDRAEALLRSAETGGSHPQIDRAWAVLRRYTGRKTRGRATSAAAPGRRARSLGR